MRIVVFGATGGTGRALLRKLLDGAHQDTVVALCRNPGALDDIKASAADASRLEVVKGDLFDAASVSAAVRGADVVVFTAGTTVALSPLLLLQCLVLCAYCAWRFQNHRPTSPTVV